MSTRVENGGGYEDRASHGAEGAPVLSVLMPVFNEAPTVETILERVLAVKLSKEIVVVDDGSTDGTRGILERMEARYPDIIRVVLQPENGGKGSAIREAIRRARGSISIIQDADLEYDPEDYPALVAPILERRTNVVFGSRPLCEENDYPFDLFRMGSLFLTVLTNLLYVCHLTDEPTCYKVFRTDVLQSVRLRCRGFEFCPEVTAKVLKRGERILEVPIRYHKRSVEEGKKIRFHDAIVGAWTLLRYRFTD